MRLLIMLCIGAAVLLGTGCSSGVTVLKPAVSAPVLQEDTALSDEARSGLADLTRQQADADYIVGLKDLIVIEVWQADKPEIQRKSKVNADGTIDFPLIGKVAVAGLTESQIGQRVKEQIGEFIKDPFVSARVTSVISKRIYIFGEVQTPGIVPLNDQYRLLDIILKAGGVTPLADLSRGIIIRGETVLPVDFYGLLKNGEMANNIYVQPGDKILLPSMEDRKVFVFGEVGKPGIVFIDRELNLLDAITNCEGLTPEANPTDVRIIRGGLQDPTVYLASINQLIKGNVAHNVALEHGDIVFVPAKGIVHWQRFMSRVLPSLTDLYLLRQLSKPE